MLTQLARKRQSFRFIGVCGKKLDTSPLKVKVKKSSKALPDIHVRKQTAGDIHIPVLL